MSQLLADPSASPRVGVPFPSIQCARSSEDFRGVGGGVPEPRAAQPGPSSAAGAPPRTPPVSSNSTNGAVGGDYTGISRMTFRRRPSPAVLMILPRQSRLDNRSPGTPSPCGALRAASKQATVGSARRVSPIGDRPPLPSPCVSCDLGGEPVHLNTTGGGLSRRIRSRIARNSPRGTATSAI